MNFGQEEYLYVKVLHRSNGTVVCLAADYTQSPLLVDHPSRRNPVPNVTSLLPPLTTIRTPSLPSHRGPGTVSRQVLP